MNASTPGSILMTKGSPKLWCITSQISWNLGIHQSQVQCPRTSQWEMFSIQLPGHSLISRIEKLIWKSVSFQFPGSRMICNFTFHLSADRPRVKNYYRNAQVGFWNSFIPQLHKKGKEAEPVGEEHHLLPEHFRKDSYFGKTRHFSSFANLPFPPPPMPPSPPPELTTKPKTSECEFQKGYPNWNIEF